MPGVRAFMALRILARHGVIQQVLPPQETIPLQMDGHRLLVVLESRDEADTLRVALKRISEIAWVRIGRGAAAAGFWLDMPARERRDADVEQQAVGPAQINMRVALASLDHIDRICAELNCAHQELRARLETMTVLPADEHCQATIQRLTSLSRELVEQMQTIRRVPASQLLQRYPRFSPPVKHTVAERSRVVHGRWRCVIGSGDGREAFRSIDASLAQCIGSWAGDSIGAGGFWQALVWSHTTDL